MFTVKETIKNEIIINKSKFITIIVNINSIDDAKTLLKDIKEKYNDATHVCYAYKYENYKKASDDGEPSHTAGLPILNVLDNKSLNNILAVVVRYFGGIKLGAGGLVRAYSNSISNALNSAKLIKIIKEEKYVIEFNYDNLKNIEYILKDYKVINKEFNDKIKFTFICCKYNYPTNLNKYIIKND